MRTQYLARYAEPEAALASTIEGEWEHVLVVPACGETASLLDGFGDACLGRRVLIVLVVNGRDDHDAAVHAANERLLQQLCTGAQACAPGLWLQRGPPDVLIVDRARPGRRFGTRDGVGLARKLGCDVALALAERIATSWIHMTDADATLPASYFEANAVGAAALVRPFVHVPSGHADVDDAHRRYEISLRYYVLALRWAGSPYAFHTIGSTITVDRDAYAAVRGVPRRQAGEDFYLLNKLAKVGQVSCVGGEPVRIASRRSARVPFGTGPAVDRLLVHAQGPDVYAPASFVALRAWLSVLRRAAAGAWDEHELDGLDPESRTALEHALAGIGARPALTQLHERHRGEVLRRQLDGWFDGFRTLRLIHELRDAGLADRPWPRALAEATFLGPLDHLGGVESVRRVLAECEIAP